MKNINIDKSFNLEIDGKQVNLRVNNSANVLYKKHFRRGLIKTLNKYKVIKKFPLSFNDSTEVAQIVWVFAKIADPKILPYKKWILSFEEFPIAKILPAIVKKIKE